MKQLLNWIRRTLDHDLSLGYTKPARWSCLLCVLVLVFALTLTLYF